MLKQARMVGVRDGAIELELRPFELLTLRIR